ncbi:protein FAM183A isoform X4 [Bos indicus x Bos taurus]|uniref:protein FAM183A isoform X4 n=1 Tax=Bos indicus x Bos taurus TaxID=30522 RepID=UPI000F7D0B8E|nr:protein FAM183A isoform X4 [Bos indicus x Bos taurus]
MITWKNLQMTCREEHKKNPVPVLRSLSNLLCFPRNAPRARFLNLIHHAAQGPRKKYPETQTEGQEIGWDSEPLVNPQRDDRRLNHFRVYKDITLYKAKMWSLGEDDHHK